MELTDGKYFASKKVSKTFLAHCMTPEYAEIEEERSWDGTPEFRLVLDPLNRQEYGTACREAQQLIVKYPDLDLPYVWYAAALIREQQFDEANVIAHQGLAASKRKYNLCEQLGEIAWKTGRLLDSVYWWAQAWHCQESFPELKDYTVFLYLHYIALEVGLEEVAGALIGIVDRLRSGQIRLDVNAAAGVRRLARTGDTTRTRNALISMAKLYFGVVSTSESGTGVYDSTGEDLVWSPGKEFEEPGRMDVGLVEGILWDESFVRPSLTDVWIIPCRKIQKYRYIIVMNAAQKTGEDQRCIIESLPPGEYTIAYNPFPIGSDVERYRNYWDGRVLDYTSTESLFDSLTGNGREKIQLWAGPRGGQREDAVNCVNSIKANTGVGISGEYPIVVEFLADHKPYTSIVAPSQTAYLVVRAHAYSMK